MKKIILLVLISLILASFVYAAARWYPTTAVYEMKEKAFQGYCPTQGQCLVGTGPDYNESLNGQPEKYFTANKPRCINSGQFILDYYCDNGVWTSRTKLVALRLLKFANAQNDYVVYCDKFDKVFNQVMYTNAPGGSAISAMFSDYRCFNNLYPCYNNVCVLKYQGTTAIGISMNAPINDTHYSFLLAMNQSDVTHCNSVPSNAPDFTRCTATSKFYYNPSLKSIIYLPIGQLQQGADYTALFNTHIKPGFDAIKNYVDDELPDADYIAKTSLFNRLYFAKKDNKKIFGFHEVDQKSLSTNYKSYFGISYQGHSFGTNPCFNIFRQIQNVDIYCENQPSANQFLVIGKLDGVAKIGSFGVWNDLTSKLRP